MELRSRVLIGFAIAGVVVCGGGTFLGLRYFDIPFASGQAESAAAAYRKAGLPWEAADLAPNPPVSKAENAAPLLKAAIASFDWTAFDKEHASLVQKLDEGQTSEVDKELSRYNRGLDSAAKAAERPRVDFKRDWDYGHDILLPEYAGAKALVRAFCLRAEVRAARNDISGTSRDLSTGLRLSALMGQEPCVIAMLVEIACNRLVFTAIQRCAAQLVKNPKGLESVATALKDEANPDFVDALRGEAYLGLATLRNFDPLRDRNDAEDQGQNPPPIDPADLKRTGLPDGYFIRAFTARFFQNWTAAKALMDRFPDDPERLGHEMEAVTDRSGPGLSNILSDILMPTYVQAGTADAVCEADRRVTAALLQALIIRAQTGRLPTRIDEIPGIWIDPFGGGPLLMKTQGDSIRIYSIGPNHEDDGGVSLRELKGDLRKDYDVVAAYPPIKKR